MFFTQFENKARESLSVLFQQLKGIIDFIGIIQFIICPSDQASCLLLIILHFCGTIIFCIVGTVRIGASSNFQSGQNFFDHHIGQKSCF